MAKFEEYADKYKFVKMERRDGILQMTLHSDGKELLWGAGPHRELGDCFWDIANDPHNKVIILTGTGKDFIAELDEGPLTTIPTKVWDKIYFEGKKLLTTLLDVPVPMIAAVNGPANVHAELAVLCDIVLAADHANFSDAPHFSGGLVPGDGVHLVWPLLLGPNRGRYFLLTGEEISAEEAKSLGVVAEVMPQDDLLPRAWELAEKLCQQPTLTMRYARVAMTQQLKKMMLENLGYGLALEGLAASDFWPGGENAPKE